MSFLKQLIHWIKLTDKARQTNSKKIRNELLETIDTLDCDMAHPRRPRCKYMGEMIQMDWYYVKILDYINVRNLIN